MAFTRNWDESNPTDLTVANQIDDYNRYLRVDVSDRLENMFYGFIAGENTLSQHAQYIQFYEQASVSQPSAGYGRLYCKAVGGKCELYWQDEDGDEKQITEGGIIKIAATDIANDLIDSQHYAAASIDNEHLANGAVDTEELAADCIDGTKIADDTVDSEHLAAAGIDTEHIGTIFGARTNQDDESNAMLAAHAYLANQDGFVIVVWASSSSATVSVYGYVDTDTNPASGGTTLYQHYDIAFTAGEGYSGMFPVQSGQYFEVVTSNVTTFAMYWQPIGTLIKCTDQD